MALATLADMMPRVGENEVLISEGLLSLEKSWRPGIQPFFELEYFNHYLTLEEKVSKIISILNVRDVKDNLPASFRLLTSTSQKKAALLIERLIKKSEVRRERIK